MQTCVDQQHGRAPEQLANKACTCSTRPAANGALAPSGQEAGARLQPAHAHAVACVCAHSMQHLPRVRVQQRRAAVH